MSGSRSSAATALSDPSVSSDPNATGALRTDRQVGWLISLGGSVLIVGRSPGLVSSLTSHPSWWTVAAAFLAVTVLSLATLGRVLPFPLLRACWVCVPVIATCLWATAYLANTSAAVPLLWAWTLEPVVASYLVLWLSPAPAIVVTVASGLLPALSALIFLGTVPNSVAVTTPILLANVVYLAIFYGIHRRLTNLRVVESEARRQHRLSQTAAAEARRQERLRRLIHDEVLSVLSAAMRFSGTPPPPLRAEARHALLLLDSPDPTSLTALVDAHQAIASFAAALRRIDPTCPLSTQVRSGLIPTPVLDTVMWAAAEALRNSVKHAGPSCPRTITASFGGAAISVVLRDQGPGFEPAAVDIGRLGVRESILARMTALPGGYAHLLSSPGRGVEVELTWRR